MDKFAIFPAESPTETGVRKAHEYFYQSDVGDDRLYKCPSCRGAFPASAVKDTIYCPGCSLYIDNKHFYNAIEVRF